MNSSTPQTAWIFAYGSLLWKPGFAYAEARRGFVRGWTRRFWQGSTDHRGVEHAPGRVVTLVESPGDECWGLAYRLAPTRAAETLRTLDRRERAGYCRMVAQVHLADSLGEAVPALVYLATPRNRNYLGPAPMRDIARQIATAGGPSGTNLQYLEELAQALRALAIDDRHVFELESMVTAERRALGTIGD